MKFHSAILVLGLISGGCLDDGGELLDTSTVESEIGEASCASAQATATLSGFYNYTSPQTYDTVGCAKAVIVDVLHASSSHLTAPTVAWDGSLSTQSNCTSATVQATLYDATTVISSPPVARGVWACRFGSCSCTKPRVTFGVGLQANHNYRVAASAKFSDGTTRVLRITN